MGALCWVFIDPEKPVFAAEEGREPVLATA
jgi:hypothetical protein